MVDYDDLCDRRLNHRTGEHVYYCACKQYGTHMDFARKNYNI